MFENVINFFKKIGRRDQIEEKSKDTAKERLHLVLMQDRANVSADFLDMMRQEIIEVIKKYIDVDEKDIDVRLTNKTNEDGTMGAPALYANIPIAGIREEMKKEKNIEKETEEKKQENAKKEATTEEYKNSKEAVEEKASDENNEEVAKDDSKDEELDGSTVDTSDDDESVDDESEKSDAENEDNKSENNDSEDDNEELDETDDSNDSEEVKEKVSASKSNEE